MSCKFNGFDWSELAQCWGITVEEQPLNIIGSEGNEDLLGKMKTPEKIEITKYINNTKMIFETEDEQEVLAEKLKRYVFDNLDYSTGFKKANIRTDMESFLQALIEEEKDTGFSSPVYEGMLKVDSDEMFAKWFCSNLEMMWT